MGENIIIPAKCPNCGASLKIGYKQKNENLICEFCKTPVIIKVNNNYDDEKYEKNIKLGNRYFDDKNYLKAYKYFEKALELNPDDNLIYIKMLHIEPFLKHKKTIGDDIVKSYMRSLLLCNKISKEKEQEKNKEKMKELSKEIEKIFKEITLLYDNSIEIYISEIRENLEKAKSILIQIRQEPIDEYRKDFKEITNNVNDVIYRMIHFRMQLSYSVQHYYDEKFEINDNVKRSLLHYKKMMIDMNILAAKNKDIKFFKEKEFNIEDFIKEHNKLVDEIKQEDKNYNCEYLQKPGIFSNRLKISNIKK